MEVLSQFDKEMFELILSEQKIEAINANEASCQLRTALQTACDASMPRSHQGKGKQVCYWWNDTIRSMKKECGKARRLVLKAESKKLDTNEELKSEYKSRKRSLQKAIKASKKACFQNICEEANVDVWSTAYKLVTKKLAARNTPTVTCPAKLERIVSECTVPTA